MTTRCGRALGFLLKCQEDVEIILHCSRNAWQLVVERWLSMVDVLQGSLIQTFQRTHVPKNGDDYIVNWLFGWLVGWLCLE